MKTGSIIGSCGRKGLIYRLHTDTSSNMLQQMNVILEELHIENIHIQSGGAALADHIAVTLFIEGYINKLTLHLPCEWDSSNKQF